jgi:hypothetical protein
MGTTPSVQRATHEEPDGMSEARSLSFVGIGSAFPSGPTFWPMWRDPR